MVQENASEPELDGEQEPELEPGYRAAQLLSSIDGGDVLPEADIVSNIVDKLERWDGQHITVVHVLTMLPQEPGDGLLSDTVLQQSQ